MLKAIRIISLSFFLPMLLASTAMAEIILHGIIRHEHKSTPITYYGSGYGDDTKSFPKKYYKYRLHAYDLTYDDKVSLKDRRYNISISSPEYNASILARLDLISADEKNNIYKFKLSFHQSGLDYMGEKLKKLWQVGGTPFDADIKFDDGTLAVFFIDVSIGKNELGNPKLINLKNNKYFELAFSSNELDVNLIRKSDFPVNLIESLQRKL